MNNNNNNVKILYGLYGAYRWIKGDRLTVIAADIALIEYRSQIHNKKSAIKVHRTGKRQVLENMLGANGKPKTAQKRRAAIRAASFACKQLGVY